jgi:hypothetical protein
MKFIHLVTTLLFVTLISCQSNQTGSPDEPGEQPHESAGPAGNNAGAVPGVGTLTGDTLNISGKLVLFFGPADSAGIGQPEAIRNYQDLTSQLIDSLSAKSGINALYSTAGYFRIYTSKGTAMVISKSALESETGILMTDGAQPPTIRKGTFTESEYHHHIKSYFLGQ